MDDLHGRIRDALGSAPVSVTRLDGGEIGTVRRVDLDDGRTVVTKTGSTPLSIEADMLDHLARRSELPVPDVLYADDDLLVLTFVEGTPVNAVDTDGGVSAAVEREAADHLAALHGVSVDRFGFGWDTLDGPIPQPNPWTDEWIPFFRECRLRHCADLAVDGGDIPQGLSRRIRLLAADLDDRLTEPERPALLHGDAWGGNVLVDDGRITAWLDPAIYYGHPETDLAYVAWTDTFGEPFFERYRKRRGIEDGFFEDRVDIYACHPLLVHTIVFDDDRYVRELDRTLARLGY